MLDCLILGDSLAAGVAAMRPDCAAVARPGIGSGAFVRDLLPAAPRQAGLVVVSLGANDGAAPDTLNNLRRLRRSLAAERVTWLLPGLGEAARRAVRTVAAENKDRTVDTAPHAGADGLHPGPDGYRRIASAAAGDPAPSGTGRVAVLAEAAATAAPGAIYGAWPSGPFAAIPPRVQAPRGSAGRGY